MAHTVKLSSSYIVMYFFENKLCSFEISGKDRTDAKKQFKEKHPNVPLTSIFKIVKTNK